MWTASSGFARPWRLSTIRSLLGEHDHVVYWLSAHVHQLLEGLPELGVENGVYHGVDEAVHVAEPCGQDEGSHPRLTLPPQFGAHGVHYVAREERHPAYQEHPCSHNKYGVNTFELWAIVVWRFWRMVAGRLVERALAQLAFVDFLLLGNRLFVAMNRRVKNCFRNECSATTLNVGC